MDDQAPLKLTPVERQKSTRAARKLQIPIKKGHVRRAIRAADTIYATARVEPGNEIEAGLVLMTAVLLVERLASAAGCEPMLVLNRMADCFELKRVYAKALKQGMLT